MAGHSQFKNIMFRKNKQDAHRSKLFSKLSREITVSAKLGLPDPAHNPRLRAAIAAHRRAGHAERAIELVDRAASSPVDEPGRWFSLVQLLTEAGETERASVLLAEIARGDHPEALNRRLIHGDPVRRLSAARRRLTSAQRRDQRTTRARAAAGRLAS